MSIPPAASAGPWLSIGLIACNEQAAIGAALASLFGQNLFAELALRGRELEILCLANGCTDQTVPIAQQYFERHGCGRVIELAQRGKLPAWNQFVHRLSAPSAELLILMDADIVLHTPATLWNLCRELLEHPTAVVATDQPIKHLALKADPSWRERLSLRLSAMTQNAASQLSGQLYCIRAQAARCLYMPQDLTACEDGYLKALLATAPGRIRTAPGAAHVFQAYTALGEILRNQKRQMIGQSILHVLVDQYLAGQRQQGLALAEVAAHLRQREQRDPAWLQRLVADHLCRSRYFWRLFPNAVRFRWERWAGLPAGQRWRAWPAALVGFGVTMWACWQARRLLRRGTLSYWPQTQSAHLAGLAGSWKRNTTSA